MYRELQKLRGQNRELHVVFIPTPSEIDVENFMVLKSPMTQSLEVALLDNASIHTILSLQFFSFPTNISKWSTCHVTTIAG